MEEERRRIIKEKTEKEAKETVSTETTDGKKPVTTQKDTPTIPENIPGSVHKFLTDDYEDEDDAADADMVLKGDEDQVGMKVDGKTRTTIRNLRIREDTAKYLINLDPDSAFYDPKTRSMRANPLPNVDPSQQEFVGENAMRYTGDVSNFHRMQSYAIEATEKGQEIHMQAAPSQSELLHKEYATRKEKLLEQQQKKILEQYGGEEHLKAPAKELLLGQTEAYVEYSQDGKLISGQEKVILSKWEEDVHPGNHTSVWGSFWSHGKWGYACCYQMEKNSYCLGEAGKKAHNYSRQLKEQRQQETFEQQQQTALKKQQESAASKESGNQSSSEPLLKKRKYNSLESCEVTEEQMEEYRMKRQRTEDPMADYFAQQS